MNIGFMKMLAVCLSLVLGTAGLSAQEKLKISGKIRVIEPVEVRLEDIEGNVLHRMKVENSREFAFPAMHIEPDVYWLCFGKTRQLLYLSNVGMRIKGFYNVRNVEASSLELTGLDDYYRILDFFPKEKAKSKMTVPADIKGKLEGNMYSALAYISGMTSLEQNRRLMDCMTDEARRTLSGKWLQRRIDSLEHYSLGAVAPDFELLDKDGRKVRLSDFRGKTVLLDFCASWCGPCRFELKSLRTIYGDLKGDDLVFLSISMDAKEKDWRRMVDEEALPWQLLWNKEGFGMGDKITALQRDYGFLSIPFIVLIDGEGRLLARKLRGEEVRKAILKVREK